MYWTGVRSIPVPSTASAAMQSHEQSAVACVAAL